VIDRPETVLQVKDLGIQFKVGLDWLRAIDGVSFEIPRGETFGLVGESGCGKSTIAMAVVRYLARNGRIDQGSIELGGQDITDLSVRELREVRLKRVSMVYQNPATALNPSLTVGRQVGEVYDLLGVSGDRIDSQVRSILEKVQIADSDQVMGRYPHQLSGGMLQRVVIAMAIASEPELLILDEPTTGLDATVEAEVLDLVRELRDEVGTSVLFISHNLAVIRKMSDRVGVLYAGRMVATGSAEEVFTNPRHPYTVGLLRALPSPEDDRNTAMLDTIPGFLPPIGTEFAGCVFVDRCGIAQDICHTDPPPAQDLGVGRMSLCHFPERAQDLPRTVEPDPPARQLSGEPLLEIRNASKTFIQDGQPVYALSGVDLTISEGETVGLVGESGSGKSTLAKVILGVHEPDDGTEVVLNGQLVAASLTDRAIENVRAIQMVFQNPDSALNRRHSIKRIIGRAVRKLLGVDAKEAAARTERLMEEVRMGLQLQTVKPSHLSGGLKQRVAIARAFAGAPKLVVTDEPTSALDVSVQAAIINLLAELQAEEGVAYLFISHDLSVVRYIADRVAVMYLGRLMEVGASSRIFEGPHHPYTEALLSASPALEGRERIELDGEIPSASEPPSGCVFQTRCQHKIGEICETVEPDLVEVEPGYELRCHHSVADLAELQVPVQIG